MFDLATATTGAYLFDSWSFRLIRPLGPSLLSRRVPICSILVWFGREEYGGQRDILLLPGDLVSLDHRRAFLWTPTTAAKDRRDPWVVEIVADVNLRDHFGLQDGDVIEIRITT